MNSSLNYHIWIIHGINKFKQFIKNCLVAR